MQLPAAGFFIGPAAESRKKRFSGAPASAPHVKN
jgi:hypothetical protein